MEATKSIGVPGKTDTDIITDMEISAGYKVANAMKETGSKATSEEWNNVIMPKISGAADEMAAKGEKMNPQRLAERAFPKIMGGSYERKRASYQAGNPVVHNEEVSRPQKNVETKEFNKAAGAFLKDLYIKADNTVVKGSKFISSIASKRNNNNDGHWGRVASETKANAPEGNIENYPPQRGPLLSTTLTFDDRSYTFTSIKSIAPDEDYQRMTGSNVDTIYCVSGRGDEDGNRVMAVFSQDKGSENLAFQKLYHLPKGETSITLGGRDPMAPMTGRWVINLGGSKPLASETGRTFHALLQSTYKTR